MPICCDWLQAGKVSMGISEHERAAEALHELPALQRGPRERSIFRQKRAKGPNPLSVQKKKKPHAEGAGGQSAEVAAKAKRKRSKKKAGQAESVQAPAD